jgi:hypothetical protein
MISRLAVTSAALLWASGCFTPVDMSDDGGFAGGAGGGAGGGSAAKGRPNVMLLLDRSGSMAAPLPGGTTCASCQFPMCNESACPTRMGAVRAGLSSFLATQGTQARLGLTVYPGDNLCGAPRADQQLSRINPANDSPPELQLLANRIKTAIESQTVGGGTPTGPALRFVGTITELNDPLRDDYVVLLTDGLPNCNAMNPNVCTNPQACRCTLSGGNCGMTINDADLANFCRRGCLDQTGTVAEVMALRGREIRTIVIGFGAELTTGDGFLALSAMANAGGWVRKCQNAADCDTGDTCDNSTRSCGRPFYSVQDTTQLTKALGDIVRTLGP